MNWKETAALDLTSVGVTAVSGFSANGSQHSRYRFPGSGIKEAGGAAVVSRPTVIVVKRIQM